MIWQALVAEARTDGTLWVLGGLVVCWTLVRITGAVHAQWKRLRFLLALVLLHLLLVPAAAAMRGSQPDIYVDVRLPCVVMAAVAGVSMSGAVLFGALLPRMRIETPRIMQDVIVAGAALLAVFLVASRLGFNLSSLIATSAVITAVIGFSLQDTLGNIMGGLALQLDSTVLVGDWIKLNDVNGKVSEIRWRYTAVETRNWETVIIPNSTLMRSQVTILGRRTDQPLQLRRWIYFNVDWRHAPSEVIRVVNDALASAEIDRVAKDPPPNCVLMDLAESNGRYAARYWLTDLAIDDPTDSRVRTWIFFALRRAGIELSMPAEAIFLTQESEDRKTHKHEEDLSTRLRAISSLGLFAHVSEAERIQLAKGLHPAPFAAGEVLTRQGAQAHWLYAIRSGEASVRVTEAGLTREIAKLRDGDYFGEMGLLTGATRTATVVALTDVDCYRLDKAAFEGILRARPEIAEEVARVLARRRTELVALREDLDHAAAEHKAAAETIDLLGKIRAFFGL
jgi:small-conductance mechanosensitive channel/CRP-like cAMP-binding protein